MEITEVHNNNEKNSSDVCYDIVHNGRTRTALHENELDACTKSKNMVEQGQRFIKLAQVVERQKDELCQLRGEMKNFRRALVKTIYDNNYERIEIDDLACDENLYSHVSLEDLLRIFLKSALSRKENFFDDGHNMIQAQRLKSQIKKARDREKTLFSQISKLKQKSDVSLKNERDILQKRIIRLIDRSRYERDSKQKAEDKVIVASKKINALSDHIERLMVYLKHEASGKIRLVKERIRAQREVELLRARDSLLSKKIGCKDKLIEDLKGSISVLENQLHLMDEKYMELRLKLDWSRSFTDRVLKKRDDEIRKLNDEIALLNDLATKTSKVTTIFSTVLSLISN